MSKSAFRKSVSAPGLIKTVRHCFEQIHDTKPSAQIPLADHLMSGLAVFGLKYPSLLQFERSHTEETTRHNLKSLYGIEQAPSDTWLRERLDELNPRHLRRTYTQLFKQLQRGKGLEAFPIWMITIFCPLMVRVISLRQPSIVNSAVARPIVMAR